MGVSPWMKISPNIIVFSKSGSALDQILYCEWWLIHTILLGFLFKEVMWFIRIVPGYVILRTNPELNYSSGSLHTSIKIIDPYSLDCFKWQLINLQQNVSASTSPKYYSFQKFISLEVLVRGKEKAIKLSKWSWIKIHSIWPIQLPNNKLKTFEGLQMFALSEERFRDDTSWMRHHMDKIGKVNGTNWG